MSYTVERETHGVVIKGALPVDDLVALARAWEKQGFTIIDAGIASSLGASMVITSPAGSSAWRAEIAARTAHLDDELRWLAGTDRGMSSETIFRVLASESAAQVVARVRSCPHDDDDFGRCHRLLERMPGWRARLSEVGERFPEWKALVGAWDELTDLHVAEKSHEVGWRLQELTEVVRCDR